jgi:hypothetical protein
MAGKTSLFLDDSSERILSSRDSAPNASRRLGLRSQILREVLRRYDDICSAALPELPDEEWQFLTESARTWTGSIETATTRLASLCDACQRQRRERLFKKLMGLTVTERVALVDLIERYWAAKARGERPAAPASEKHSET